MFLFQSKHNRIAILSTLVLVVILIISLSVFFSTLKIGSNQPVLPFTINTYGDAWDGNITFGAIQLNPNNTNQVIGSNLVIMSTDGQIHYLRQSTGQDYWAIKNIAQDTLMFQGEPTTFTANDPLSATHFWNYSSNITKGFPKVLSHHDVEYNPINNTFLTLQAYVRTVNNNSILFDKIEELDPTGKILWTWDTYDYIPLSEADPYNITATANGQPVIDFTHSNALQWDYNNSVIYLNIRHTNTFYKINQTNGNIIWGCGQFGNFTLLNENGTNATSLWYHSHDTTQIAPNTFTMFDNDFDNVTNPNDCRSRMIEVTLNETDMTAKVTWSWEAPIDFWTPYFGSVMVLPNGNVMGCFGTPTHQFTQNKPWDFNNTGAIIAEVTPEGKLVRTITFPVGWEIYRVQKILPQNQLPIQESLYTSEHYPVAFTIALLFTVTLMVFIQWRRKRATVRLSEV